jgi:hypothetical protein
MANQLLIQDENGVWFRYWVDSCLVWFRKDGGEIDLPSGEIRKGEIVTSVTIEEYRG